MTQLRLHSTSALRLICFTSLLPQLAACNGDAMSVGSNDVTVEGQGACGDGVVQGPIKIRHPQDVDALLDCEVIHGDLRISVSDASERESFSLAALATLRQVDDELTIDGVPSLDGLEALEQVGSLSLQNVGVSDLLALRGLRRVTGNEKLASYGGGLEISNCPALQDLQGLEQLTTWNFLFIGECPVLESLRGLGGPVLARSIYLESLPALRDLRALDFMQMTDRILIRRTGIENLIGLTLGSTQDLSLVSNPALTSLGMRRLESVNTLSLEDNDSLVDAELPRLEEAYYIRISGNDALRSVPRYTVSSGRLIEYGPELDSVSSRPYVFEVSNNTALETVASPDGVSIVQQVSIWSNPALVSLDLGLLASAGGLQIRDNLSLSQLHAPLLQTVDDLEVVNNPELSTATLSGVKTFQTEMSGNLDLPAP